MGFLGFFRTGKRIHADPAIGELVYSPRSAFWEGETSFADAREAAVVAIPGDENGPFPQARAAFDELRSRYPTLRGDIEVALFELYENYRSDATEEDYGKGLPRLSTAAEIWATTSLDDVTIWNAEPGNVVIELTYTFEWHEGHMFAVRVEDWTVTGVSIDG